MSPRPTMFHQTLLRLTLKQLEKWLDQNPGADCFPEVDWELSPHNVYSPDLACYAPGRSPRIQARLSEPPDLLIEILSPGTKAFDLTTKKDDYERHGVAEFWAIDPLDLRVRCYRRAGSQLLEAAGAGGADGADRVESRALPGFVLDLRPLREAAAQAGR